MGGIGSGNHSGRATVASGLRLSLGKLIRDGLFRPGHIVRSSIVWTNSYTGEPVASIGYEAQMGAEDGSVRLAYSATGWDGKVRPLDYRIELVTTPQPFGGRRWWFVCPKTGRRVAKLYMPAGAVTFASRYAYRMAYSSQRLSRHDRALNRAFRLRKCLGSDGGIGAPIDKPKGMRWRTFDRLMGQLAAAEGIVDARTFDWLQRVAPRLEKQRRARR